MNTIDTIREFLRKNEPHLTKEDKEVLQYDSFFNESIDVSAISKNLGLIISSMHPAGRVSKIVVTIARFIYRTMELAGWLDAGKALVSEAIKAFKKSTGSTLINNNNLEKAPVMLKDSYLVALADELIGYGFDEIVRKWDLRDKPEAKALIDELLANEADREKLYPEPQRSERNLEATKVTAINAAKILGISLAQLAYLLRTFQTLHPEDCEVNYE